MTGNYLSTEALKQCQGLCKFYRKGKGKNLYREKITSVEKNNLWDGFVTFPVRRAAQGGKGK